MTDLDAQAVGVVAAREAKSRGFPEPEAKAFGWGAKWVAGRLPSRDEIAETLRESASNRAHDDFRDYFDAQADAVLELIRECTTHADL